MTNDETSQPGLVYLLWAVGTDRFKIGYTARAVGQRAWAIEAASPYPLKILASMPGRVRDEKDLQHDFRQHRSHREWFILAEDAVYALLSRFGMNSDYIYAAAMLA